MNFVKVSSSDSLTSSALSSANDENKHSWMEIQNVKRKKMTKVLKHATLEYFLLT